MDTTVTTKGQVTIPKAVRDMLGLSPGSKVRFRRTIQGDVVIEPDRDRGRHRHLPLLCGFRLHKRTTRRYQAAGLYTLKRKCITSPSWMT